MFFFIATNPFISAYFDSDFLGKCIFLALIALSIITWIILIHKASLASSVKKKSFAFQKVFLEQRDEPLSINYSPKQTGNTLNAYYIIYDVIRNKTLEILDKNGALAADLPKKGGGGLSKVYLSPADIALLDASVASTISSLTKYLDKHLYILSTIVTLAPFLGLLGTVYGILVTFSSMTGDASIASNQVVLGGLSLALTTTVIGLLDAIPALIGYNYLKNITHDFDIEMGCFATDILSGIELHYRRLDS